MQTEKTDTEKLNLIKNNILILKFKKWKKENPDEDYQYDEIFEFVDSLSRGDVISFLDLIVEL